MEHIGLVFPHQLFTEQPALTRTPHVLLVEHDRFFRDFRFHKQKLGLHRVSMTQYADELKQRGFEVSMVRSGQGSSTPELVQRIRSAGATRLSYVHTLDHALEAELTDLAPKAGLDLHRSDTPGLLTSLEWIREFFAETTTYRMQRFYIAQRKRLSLLLTNQGKPLGGKWSFDPANRKPLPAGVSLPPAPAASPDATARSLLSSIEDDFADNPGSLDGFSLPTSRTGALDWLDDFLERRLDRFGDYEDAIRHTENLLFHSLLSPLMNIGLLTPQDVLDRTLARSRSQAVRLNSLEGFIRQIVGWREFIYALYELEYPRLTGTNFWGHTRPLPNAFWNGQTGLFPVDVCIEKVMRTGYLHHIERLMVLGNAMLLLEIDPQEIYRWFMELFIDAYDWVMVPNVFGMSQYADGGLLASKPYISSSNYLRRMSDYPRGEWCDIWDGLFWRFIHKHRDFFRASPRLAVMARTLERMEPQRLRGHLRAADTYLERLLG